MLTITFCIFIFAIIRGLFCVEHPLTIGVLAFWRSGVLAFWCSGVLADANAFNPSNGLLVI
jgi:hypothetical protein